MPGPRGDVVTPRRRRLLAALTGLLWAVAGSGPHRLGPGEGAARAQAKRPSLYVYLHTEIKSSSLEKTLRQQLPGLEVTVFGRFRDFEEAVAREQPDAVLALQPLLAMLNIPPTLQGLRGDRDWEPYVLMTEESATETGPTARVVGAVDLLGRTGTHQLVAKLLGNSAVEVRRVTKLEDLLTLLHLSAAGAVLVPGGAAKGLSERSRLRLRVHPLTDARVGLPALGVRKGELRDLFVRDLTRLDAETLRMLGLDRWRAR
jgi:hypothetical protein